MRDRRGGYTLIELVLGTAIMAIVSVAFASLLKYVTRSTVALDLQGSAQEATRRTLSKIDEDVVHANEVRVASSTFLEYLVDLDQSPAYSAQADGDADGVPDYRDADRDNDASLLMAATAQWRVGFNLKDDDEDGDGAVDVVKRLTLTGTDLWSDTSLGGGAWGGAYRKRVAVDVSSFTLTYWGSKGNLLGLKIDLGADGLAATGDSGENDGIISAAGWTWWPRRRAWATATASWTP